MEATQAVNIPANITTIKTENGELYVQGDLIVGRMVIKGNIIRYYRGDKLHRDGDLPARIERNNAGMVICEEYYRDGKQHRDGGLPAFIWRNKGGVVIGEEYYRDGNGHRDGDHPAYIARNNAGVVVREVYYRNGKWHREGNLPAYIRRNDAGEVIKESYYRNGEEISQHEIESEKIKAMAAKYQEENAALRAELDELKKKIAALAV